MHDWLEGLGLRTSYRRAGPAGVEATGAAALVLGAGDAVATTLRWALRLLVAGFLVWLAYRLARWILTRLEARGDPAAAPPRRGPAS